MRKLLLNLALFSMLLAGCQKAENSAEVEILPAKQSPRLTYQEAVAVAQKGISWLEKSEKTRGKKGVRSINHSNTKAVVGGTTRSGEGADTLMYVFNFDNNEGFAMVATARDSEQLIAVTEQGNYTPGVDTDNEGFNMFARAAEEYVSTLAVTPGPGQIDPGGPFYKIEYQEEYDTVGPLLATKWGQSGIYGNECPNSPYGVAGCVATAMAQIMAYHQHPATMALTYSGAPTSSLTLDWDGIALHTGDCSCGANSTTIHNQISYLCREIGERVDMDYNDAYTDENGTYYGPSSGAVSSDVPAALSGLGYSSNSTLIAYDLQTIRSNIDNGLPIYMKGAQIDDDKRVGHAWVVDGYMTYTQMFITYISLASNNGPWRIDEIRYRYTYYPHCNWGWSGICDGFFNDGVFKTANAYQYDSSTGNSTSYNFHDELLIITNITPNN